MTVPFTGWPWVSRLNSLSFSFYICKRRGKGCFAELLRRSSETTNLKNLQCPSKQQILIKSCYRYHQQRDEWGPCYRNFNGSYSAFVIYRFVLTGMNYSSLSACDLVFTQKCEVLELFWQAIYRGLESANLSHTYQILTEIRKRFYGSSLRLGQDSEVAPSWNHNSLFLERTVKPADPLSVPPKCPDSSPFRTAPLAPPSWCSYMCPTVNSFEGRGQSPILRSLLYLTLN